MNNNEKLKRLLNAIDNIEQFPDNSIIINWKSNVSHNVNGVHIINATGSQILKGYQIHLNPDLSKEIKTIQFEHIQTELNEHIEDNEERNISRC